MKRVFLKRLAIAATVLLTVPAAVFGQQDDNTKNKNNEGQQIIITRKGNTDEKTVIEINGDKVKINGKDADDNKNGDVSVRVNKIRDMQNLRMQNRLRTPGNNDFNFNFDDNNITSLFSEDANRAMLGVMTDKNDKGVEITQVSEGSAAAKAGLKKGDIITKMDDKKVESAEDVAKLVHAHKPGDKIAIHILRDSKEQQLTAELGKWKGIQLQGFNNLQLDQLNLQRDQFNNQRDQLNMQRDYLKQFNEPGHPVQPGIPNIPYNFSLGNRPKLGLSIQDTEDGKGVKVLDVDDESNAAKAGIKEGDIITQVDNKEVNSADEISRIVRENKDKNAVTFKVQRNGKTQTIEVRIPRKIKTVDL